MFYRGVHIHHGSHIVKQGLLFFIKLVHLVCRHKAGRQIDHIHIDLVSAKAGKALRHIGHISVDQTYQNDNRRNADNDSKHGEERPHLVASYAF